MKIAVIGLWHMGEVLSACLAELGNNVVGIDEDTRAVNGLNKGIPPLAEPKLEDLIKSNLKKRRLRYTTDFKSVSGCKTVWVTIDTPLDEKTRGNLNKIFNYLGKILPFIKNRSRLIVSSQLQAGTSQKITSFIKDKRKDLRFDYAYIPENLRLGEAIVSFMKPSRVVIGTDNPKQFKSLIGVLKKLTTNILPVSVASAEIIKHATNAFLATSLCFIYDIADVCEKFGADVTEVSRALRADERIGEKAYLDASAGFSGGHLERELYYLSQAARSKKISLPIITAVIRKNRLRRKIVFEKIKPILETFKDKRLTFFGITYKSGTPTLTHSLPIKLAKEMSLRGAKINLCDPWVDKTEITKEMAAGKFSYFQDPREAAKGSQAIICITPWADLKNLSFRKIAKVMTKPKILFDARNYFAKERNIIEAAGIKYIGVGI